MQATSSALAPKYSQEGQASGIIDKRCLCRVCEEMLRTHLYPPTSESLALMCGPPGMQDCSMVHLEKWGYKKEGVIIF